MRDWQLHLILLFLFSAAPVIGEEPSDDAEISFFESRIRPALVEHCYECHSSEAGFREGGLHVDTRESIRAGGESGPAVVPGKPGESWLLKAISHADSDLIMPPQGEQLDESLVADFRRWIERGAADPRDSIPGASKTWSPADAIDHWAYQSPASPIAPVIETDWNRSDIDLFVLEKLRAAGLSPSVDASPETLLRRVTFDLTGLPPEPTKIEEFTQRVKAHGLDGALGDEVDRLLASDAYGERWARHWLDVARFGESSGKEANITFPYAWRFRDYVIDSFRDDVPLDQFLTQQIAGDLLPASDDAQRTRLLIATGFLALGPKNLDAADPRQFEADLIDEQIDAVTRVFMASSLACARCHDHKSDPFSMEDYYALSGVFASTKTFFGTAVSPANRVGGDPLRLPGLATTPVLHRSITAAKVAELKAQKAALEKERVDKGRALTLRDALRIFWQTGGIEGQLEKFDDQGRALPLAMGVLEADVIRDAPLLVRGDVNRPGDVIPRRLPSNVKVKRPPEIDLNQSGRLALAHWLARPDHPLTARVFVNRVWSHLFGEGLVSSVDDFGTTGQFPSHPDLLEYLAIRFVEQDWSVKRLIREIVLSRVYRQSSAFDPEAFEVDPENRMLWRMSKRRLEAEAMRDAMLAVSGELDLDPPLGSLVGRVIGDRPVSLVGLDKRLPPDLDGSLHRSIYLPVLRDRLPAVLDVFDFAEPSLVTGKRETTNVPTQALYLMNSDFVAERAAAMAKRLKAESDGDTSELIESAFLYCYGRRPSTEETELVGSFLRAGSKSDRSERLERCCQSLLSTAEFRLLD